MIMHAKYQCSVINTSEDMSQVKVFATDRRMDEWDLMSPRFRESGEQQTPPTYLRLLQMKDQSVECVPATIHIMAYECRHATTKSKNRGYKNIIGKDTNPFSEVHIICIF